MLKDLLNSKNILHLYVVARWYYQVGEPIIPDSVYDKCEQWVKANVPDSPYLKRSWEDDHEPTELIEFYDLPTISTAEKNSTIDEYLPLLLENKSISIQPVYSYKDAFNWFNNNVGTELIFLIKIDGVNTKTLIDTKKLKQLISTSRGRDSENIKDYTYSVSKVLPQTLPLDNKYLKDSVIPIYGEGYLSQRGIELYKEMYGKEFKNPRAAAVSVLPARLENEIYKYLHVCFFRIDDYKPTLSECIDDMDRIGLETPGYLVDTYYTMSYEEFVIWINEKLNILREYADSRNIPTDGVVVELNSRAEFKLKPHDDKYSDGNLALKIGPWQNSTYKGKVVGILMDSERGAKENKSVRLLIDPVTMANGNVVTNVSAWNLATIIKKDITLGSEIEFIYVSDANCVLQ